MRFLYFCQDGILRRSVSLWNPADQTRLVRHVPLKAIEASTDRDIFLKSLHDVVIFDKGLTLAQMFENIAPWADMMTGIACMDFPAFLEEIRKTPEERLEECSHIELSWSMAISPVPGFDRPMTFDKGSIGMGMPVKTGRLSIEQGWDMSAILTPEGQESYDGARSVSLSFTPLSEWGHLPVVISSHAMLRDETPAPRNAAYLGTDLPLTLPQHPNVELHAGMSEQVFSHDIKVDMPSPTFFDTVVRGLLWEIGFHYSPVTRDDIRVSLEKTVASMEDDAESVSDEDLDLEQEAEHLAEKNRLEAALLAADRLGLPVRTPQDIALRKH